MTEGGGVYGSETDRRTYQIDKFFLLLVVQAVRQRSVYVIWTNAAPAAAFQQALIFLHMPATCAHIPLPLCVGVCVDACKYRIADSSNFI